MARVHLKGDVVTTGRHVLKVHVPVVLLKGDVATTALRVPGLVKGWAVHH